MTIRVAACQIDPQLGEVDRNLERIERAVAEAGFGRATVVLPEAAVTGYVFEHLDEALTVAQRASVVAEQRLADLAAANRVALIVGSLEAEGRGSSTPPSSSPRTAAAIGTGRCTFRTWASTDSPPRPGRARGYDLAGMRVGVLICYDLRFPEAARICALEGADLIALPTNWPVGVQFHPGIFAPARAAENHVYLLAATGSARSGARRSSAGRSCSTPTAGRWPPPATPRRRRSSARSTGSWPGRRTIGGSPESTSGTPSATGVRACTRACWSRLATVSIRPARTCTPGTPTSATRARDASMHMERAAAAP